MSRHAKTEEVEECDGESDDNTTPEHSWVIHCLVPPSDEVEEWRFSSYGRNG